MTRTSVLVIACAVLALVAAPVAHAATFNVTILDDAHELDPGDGVCDTKPPGCSLRAAIEEANAFAGRDQINVPAGLYELATGLPLTVSSDVLILGASARTVGIRMAGNFETGVPFDRVFDFTSTARATLRRLTILNGRADSRNDHFGGDIRNFGQLSLIEVTVADGVANSGGGLANRGGTVTIRDSTFTNNRAPADTGAGGDAGAILNFGEPTNPASLTIETSTISTNFARLTGGIFSYNNAGNTVVIKNSTIALNQSGNRGGGGGLGIVDGTATLENTIVSNNSSPSDPLQPNCSGVIASLGHNLEHATDCGFTATGDIQGQDPDLGKLGNYGGETDTHSLGRLSAALDRANNAVCLAADQRGFFRPQGGICDIGAFELDQPPNTTFTGGPSNPTPTNDTTPTFTFVSDEPGTFLCSIDGSNAFDCASPFTIGAPLGEGPHTLDVQAVDLTENFDPTPARRNFTIDVTPPNTAFTGGPVDPTPTNDSTPTFTFNSADASATFQCSVDNAAFAACTSAHTTAVLSDGPHNIRVRARDTAGNLDPTPAVRNFTVDTTPPNTAFTGGPVDPTPTNDPTPSFTFNSPTDASATFQCSVDNAAFLACTSPRTTGALSDGAHNIRVRAIDPAGNIDPTPAMRNFTVDTTPPNTSFTGGPVNPTPTNDPTPTFTFNSPDATATFQCSVDNAAFTACTSAHTISPALGEGAHNVRVRAVDPAGNIDATPAVRNFTVDTTPPNTAITGGPAGSTNDSTPTFTFNSADASATFQCSLDNAAFTACTSPHTTAALTDGPHDIRVRARDAAGNFDATPAQRAFSVETSAPDTSITSGPSGLTNDSTPSFEFASTEPGTFRCGIDSAALAPCTSPFTPAAALADGPHTFTVEATDLTGNADASPASRAFTVDTQPPETTIDTGPAELTTDSTPTFTFSSDDPGATFECSLDSGAFASCASPLTTPPLGSGPHTFVVRAIDASGNVDPSPALGFNAAAAQKEFTLLGAAEGPPVFGASFNVEAVSGDIFVSVPVPPGGLPARIAQGRAAQAPPDYQPPIKGRVFVPLEEVRQLPVGSFVDTRYGTVRMVSARNRRGQRQAGRFSAGVFKVLQSRRRAKGITDLQLKGGSFGSCRARGGDSTAVAAGLSRRTIRRLRSSARGRFRTGGRNSSATVRGTIWEVVDRCDGTLTKVRRGKVAVRDFRLRKNVIVRAGKSYLARARR